MKKIVLAMFIIVLLVSGCNKGKEEKENIVENKPEAKIFEGTTIKDVEIGKLGFAKIDNETVISFKIKNLKDANQNITSIKIIFKNGNDKKEFFAYVIGELTPQEERQLNISTNDDLTNYNEVTYEIN